MPYTHIQCIAYKVNTFPNTDHESVSLVNHGGQQMPLFSSTKRYRGKPDGSVDVRTRALLMQDAVKQAAQRAERASGTLKLFMAPEFYFRGVNGAYDFETNDELVQLLTSAFTDDRWKDWLFVFGSILVAYEDESAGKHMVQNMVLVHKGGQAGTTRIVVKEHLSGIDFVHHNKLSAASLTNGGKALSRDNLVGGYDGEGVAHLPAMRAGKRGLEMQKRDFDGGGIFIQDDICFGVETCLDHAMTRLRASPPARGQSYVQVQLIPSAGMSIRDDAVVAVLNGLVFNCDGNPARRSELRKVTKECTRKEDATTAVIPAAASYPAHTGRGNLVASEMFADQDDLEVAIFPQQPVPVGRNSTGWFRARY